MNDRNMEIPGYEFLKFFSAITVMLDENVMFDNDYLEEELYEFATNSEYRFLFEGIEVDNFREKVNLNDAIEEGYSSKLLGIVDNYSIINIEERDAKRIIVNHDFEEVKKMYKLCNEYHNTDILIEELELKK